MKSILFLSTSLLFFIPAAQADMSQMKKGQLQMEIDSLKTSLSVFDLECQLHPDEPGLLRLFPTESWVNTHREYLEELTSRHTRVDIQLRSQDLTPVIEFKGHCDDVKIAGQDFSHRLTKEIEAIIAADKPKLQTPEEQQAQEICDRDPKAEQTFQFSFRAGWLLQWLQEYVEQVRHSFPEVLVEDEWAYRLLDRKLTLKFTGECQKALDATLEAQKRANELGNEE